MSIKDLYPTTRSVSRFDFVNGDKNSSAFSFKRNSIGTYVDENGFIKTADIEKPRITYDPETGEKLGLLVENVNSRNLLSYSSDFSTGWTTNSLSSFIPNSIISPDGTLTGTFIAFENSTVPLSNAVGLVATSKEPLGTTNTLSCYAKIGTARYLALAITNNAGLTATAVFDLQTGTVNGSGAHPSYTVVATSISNEGSGWYRCSLTSIGGGEVHISSSTSGVSGVYNRNVSGDGVSGIYVWGAQVESADALSSYIPTSGSAVTRFADEASIKVSDLQSGRLYYRSNTNKFSEILKLKDSTNTPEYSLSISSRNNIPSITTKLGGVNQSVAVLPSVPSAQTKDIQVSFNFDKTTGRIDLSTTATDNDTASVIRSPEGRSIPSGYTLDTIELTNGIYKSLNVWDENLSVSKLSSLSEEYSSTDRDISTSAFITSNSFYSEADPVNNGVPTLDLNFAENKSLIDSTSNTNLVTFTRQSNATYVDSDGIIKPSNLNIIPFSENQNGTGWTGSATSFTSYVGLDPNGNQSTIYRFEFPNTISLRYYISSVPQNSALATASIYVKRVSGGDKFLISAQSSTSAPPNGRFIYNNATITDEWQRVDTTSGSYTGTNNGNWAIIFGNDTRIVTNPAITVDVWGAQLETGIDVTPYVSTNGTSNAPPRFDHDPETGESLGLLIEENRTNLAIYSEYYKGAWIIQTGASVIPNQAIAPNGEKTASLFKGTGNINNGVFLPNRTVSGSSNNTKSIYLRSVSGTSTAQLKDPNSTQTIITCNLTTEWQRFILTETQSGGSAGIWIDKIPTEGIYVWGAQLEQGSFPTSYIPTPASFASRNSIATYYDADGIIQTAIANESRNNAYLPDQYGVFRRVGSLLEAVATNNVLYSVDLENPAWTPINATITNNATSAPNGLIEGVEIESNGSVATQRVGQSGITGTITISIFAKAGSARYLQIIHSENAQFFANFDLQNGTKGTFGTASKSSIEYHRDGWYRCSLTVTTTINAQIYFYIAPSATATYGQSYVAQVDSLYLWGAQLEQGSFATSYIPTAGSTITRVADTVSSSTATRTPDIASITGTNFSSWYNQTESTIFANFRQYANQGGWRGIYASSVQGGYPELQSFNSSGGGSAWMQTYSGSTEITFAIAQGSPHKTAITHKGGVGISGSIDGGSINSKSYISNETGATNVNFYAGYYGERNNGHLSRLTYWPNRLPDTILQAITSPTVDTWDLVFDSRLVDNSECAIINVNNCTYEVDWGDGTVETINGATTQIATHTYLLPDEYTAKINVLTNTFRPSYVTDQNIAKALVEVKETPSGFPISNSFNGAFYGCSNLRTFDRNVDTSGVLDFTNAFRNCSSLVDFPEIDTSSATNLTTICYNCTSLETFPKLNTSNVTNFSNGWRFCKNLKEFHLIDTSQGSNFILSWADCTSLEYFPPVDLSSGTEFDYSWYNCTSLRSFFPTDMSSATDINRAWAYCSSLETFPLISVPLATDISESWVSCTKLESFPPVQFPSATRFYRTWYNNTKLKYFPENVFDTTGTLTSDAFKTTFSFSSLTAGSVENILTSLDTNGQSNIELGIEGGGIAGMYSWSSPAWNGFNNLVSKGWTISKNDDLFSATNTPLDLRFAETKTLDSRITFSRSSIGTYVDSNGVIQTATANTPRFDHDPDTLESLGLLVEENRSNQIPNSNLWNNNNNSFVSIITGQSSPDGGTNGVRIESSNASSSTPYAGMSGNIASGDTVSVFVKPDEVTKIWLTSLYSEASANGLYASYDFDTLQTSTGSGASNAKIEPYQNGWYRCSFTANTPSGAFSIVLTLDYAKTISLPFTAQSVPVGFGVYAFGAQREFGPSPTSYIPTTGGTLTRTPDIASISGTDFSGFYNQSEGTVFAQYDGGRLTVFPAGYGRIATTEAWSMEHGSDPIKRSFGVTGGVYNVFDGTVSADTGRPKYAIAYKNSTYVAAASDGVPGTSITGNVTFSVTATKLEIASVSNVYQLNGHISRLTYWPKRLPDGALKYITS